MTTPNLEYFYNIMWYVDSKGRKTQYLRYNIPFQVVNGKIELGEIPDSIYKIRINGMTEINLNGLIKSTTIFKCNYNTGTLYFDSSQEGKFFNITFNARGKVKYYSKNMILEDKYNVFASDNVEDALYEAYQRINNLITSNPQPSEIVDGRLNGATGQLFTTLGGRLNYDSAEITNAKIDTIRGITYNTIQDRLNKDSQDIKELLTSVSDMVQYEVTNYSTWNDVDKNYVIDINALNTALANGNGGVLFFNASNFTYSNDLILCPNLIVKGQGQKKTIIKYTGTGKAMRLPTNTTSDIQYNYKDIKFQDFTLLGNGLNVFGTGATNDGIYIGDETNTNLYNVPFLRFYNVNIRNFKKGIYLEGYGHTLQDFYIGSCVDGLTIVHPEQVLLLNPWIEYCNVGIASNPNYKLQAGHRLTIIGGGIQRNHIGGIFKYVYQLRLETYCELNDTNDFVIGDETTYDKGVHGAIIDINTTNDATNCCIGIYHSIGIKTHVECNGAVTTVPHVIVDGYSKDITIYSNTESIKSSNPWKINGDATKNNNVKIIIDNISYYFSQGILKKYGITDYTTGIQTELMNENIQWVGNANGYLINMLNDSSYNISLNNGAHSAFKILDNNLSELFSVLAVAKQMNFNGDFYIQDSSRGIVLKTPDGSKYFRISLNNDGTLKTTQL